MQFRIWKRPTIFKGPCVVCKGPCMEQRIETSLFVEPRDRDMWIRVCEACAPSYFEGVNRG